MAKQAKTKPGAPAKPARPGFAPKGPAQGNQGKPMRVPVKK